LEHFAGFILTFGFLNLLTFFVTLFKRCGNALSEIDGEDLASLMTIIRQEFTMRELFVLNSFLETGKVMVIFGVIFLML
jgi:hypothetical protein